jgi:hypothetical protein
MPHDIDRAIIARLFPLCDNVLQKGTSQICEVGTVQPVIPKTPYRQDPLCKVGNKPFPDPWIAFPAVNQYNREVLDFHSKKVGFREHSFS